MTRVLAAGYRPPLADIAFTLAHIVPVAELRALEPFEHADPATVASVLDEAGRFAAEVVAPTNRTGDVEGATLTADGVRCPVAVREAYRRYVEAGWGALTQPVDHGGGGFPLTVGVAARELLTAANLALSMAPTLAGGVAQVLASHGSAGQRERYLPRLVTGEWLGTMAITEPQAGSDLGPIATRAVPDGAGYRLTGQKIFISYGDHDLTEQIVHLVLARTPDAPPGTRGLSLFLVPKWTADGRRNDVRAVGLERKLGIRAAPTCTMVFGAAGAGAEAEIVGAPHTGLRQMFTMMNDARLGVAVQGLGVAERAFQQAVTFARQRQQGRFAGAPAVLTAHPDVRRMLLTMKASIEAMRAMCYLTGYAIDLAAHHPVAAARAAAAARADLLTPIVKAWCTDTAVELTSLAIQVHGGMGFVEETGVAQYYRDVRVTPIYEGTNGIQALDLVGRKLGADGGLAVQALFAEIDQTVRQLPARLARLGAALSAAAATLTRSTARVSPAGATPYLRGFGLVLGGWLLARGAAGAAATADGDPVARGRLLTADFYAGQLLPQAHAHFAAAVDPGAVPTEVWDRWQ
ncbi:acyl-CoA dehydrogenase [Solwaraspora sp. WMMD1047]|uniref:acyl-CoA dehydrogenase n=1 Tax=Solwaraspora sp. WMMD1047 TaxID=3016102 RepID=UPI002416E716|nr:acyl-CoA dehydrogenase [Solwaraspora sp. WMMD1047]MDG4834307.1 acyl-CoA dehydrogenase [Solwaraspora sp. WMMD1047]